MSNDLLITLDAMGGDHGPKVVIPGAARALRASPDLRFILFGRQDEIRAQLAHFPDLAAASEVYHTDVVVSAHEKLRLRCGPGEGPVCALRLTRWRKVARRVWFRAGIPVPLWRWPRWA